MMENNSEMFKSWTLIKNQEDPDASASHLTPEINSEESDGISVISESEVMSKANSANCDSDNEMEKTVVFQSNSDDEFNAPLTPPMTPCPQPKINIETIKEVPSVEIRETVQSLNVNLWIGVVFCVFAAISYSQVNNLKIEINAINLKLSQLEQENQMLKNQIDALSSDTQQSESTDPQETVLTSTTSSFTDKNSKDEVVVKPKTKTVWLGNEHEGKVEIIDKKKNAMLPDYCYFTDANDLFYDYNNEICENKRRKLEAKSVKEKKLQKKVETVEKSDTEIEDWEPQLLKPYDEYVTEMMMLLNDEIQDIKRSTSPVESPDVAPVQPSEDVLPAKPEEMSNERREKLREPKIHQERRDKRRLSKQKAVKSGEWFEARMDGRDEARKNLKKPHQEQNWFLERKSGRENRRVEAGAGSQP